jgi:hypothetical protein
VPDLVGTALIEVGKVKDPVTLVVFVAKQRRVEGSNLKKYL